jgi:uncharacterized protein (TIGR03435 family)
MARRAMRRSFLMLRSLLEDRFQLKLHRETKELPVYALTVAKSGPNCSKPKEGGCIPIDPNGMLPPPSNAPGQPDAGFSLRQGRGARESLGCGWRGERVAMPEFIRMLSMVLGRPVLDRTGFTETFDVRLDLLPG